MSVSEVNAVCSMCEPVRISTGSRAAGLFALVLLLSSLSALATAGSSPQSGTSTIAATVLDDCRVDGASGPAGWTVNFGTYQMTSANAMNFSAVLYCTKGVVISSVTLDNGLHYASSSRNMADGLAHLLPYTVYTSDCASAVTPWDGINTPVNFQSVTSSSVRTPIGGSQCAKIAAGVNVPSGSYNDSVTITINFT